MHGTIVTFWHLVGQDEGSEELHHHLDQLGDWPGLYQYTVLQDGGQCAFVLLFASEQAADSYLESEALSSLSCSERCWDVFIRRFDSATTAVTVDELRQTEMLAGHYAFANQEQEADA